MQVLAALLGLSLLVQADPTATVATVESPPPPVAALPATTVRLAAGTEVEIELVEGLSSATGLLSQRFPIRLAAPILVDGRVIVAAGALGEGEIIDVTKAGINGKQGKLIIAARFLNLNGTQVRIRGMTVIAAGKSRVDLATGMMMVPYVGLATVFVRGGNIEMPAGTRAIAKLATDVEIPINQTSDSGGDVH